MAMTINWFEIPVSDPIRAAEFYGTVMGEPLGEMDGPDGPMKTFRNDEGAIGALIKAEENNPPSAVGVLIYLGCEDIEQALIRAVEAGGTIHQPRTPIGPIGFIGSFLDPDGNRIALHTPA